LEKEQGEREKKGVRDEMKVREIRQMVGRSREEEMRRERASM
jgi:hypothetical protein